MMNNKHGLPFKCIPPSPYHPFTCTGEWSEAENPGVREIRPAVLRPGREEEGDESESDSRAGREGELHPRSDEEIQRPPRGGLQDSGDGDPDDGGARDGFVPSGQEHSLQL